PSVKPALDGQIQTHRRKNGGDGFDGPSRMLCPVGIHAQLMMEERVHFLHVVCGQLTVQFPTFAARKITVAHGQEAIGKQRPASRAIHETIDRPSPAYVLALRTPGEMEGEETAGRGAGKCSAGRTGAEATGA